MKFSLPTSDPTAPLSGEKAILLPLMLMVALLLTAPRILRAENQNWYTNLADAYSDARKGDRPIMVHVYAEWCTNCRRMERMVYPSPSVADELRKFTTVRIDGEKNRSVMESYDIRGFPTLLFLDKNGYLLKRTEGGMDSGELLQILREVEKKKGIERKILQDLKQSPAGVQSNFNAGNYYYETKNYRLAREHYLKAFRSRERGEAKSKRDSLYNAAVTDMSLKDYKMAVTHWSLFITSFPEEKRDRAGAFFYRGVSYRHLKEKEKAKRDFQFAAEHHPSPEMRASALRLLDSLD